MKSKLLSVLMLVGMGIGTWAAEADSGGFYAKFDFGADLPSDAKVSEFVGLSLNPKEDLEMDPGIRGDLALGLHLSDTFAIELESGVAYNQMDSIAGLSFSGAGVEFNVYQVPVLLNVIYRIPIGDRIRPYIGAGAGGVFAMVEGDESDDDITYAWQVQAGVEFKIGEALNLGVGYKLLGTGEIEWADFMTIDSLMTHSVFASLRLEF